MILWMLILIGHQGVRVVWSLSENHLHVVSSYGKSLKLSFIGVWCERFAEIFSLIVDGAENNKSRSHNYLILEIE